MSNLPMSNVYRVVFVQERGFGWFTPEDWAETPSWAREQMRILATVETEEEAKRICETLPQTWERPGEPPDLHCQNGEWWVSTGVHATDPQGQEIELFVPRARPLPVFSVATVNEREITAYTRLTTILD